LLLLLRRFVVLRGVVEELVRLSDKPLALFVRRVLEMWGDPAPKRGTGGPVAKTAAARYALKDFRDRQFLRQKPVLQSGPAI
jgi:hypothetical protein